MKARWREIWRSELVTVPSFSAQPAAGSRMWAKGQRVVVADAVGNDDQRAARQRAADAFGIWQAHHGVGGHDPHRTNPALVDGLEQIDGLVSGLVGDAWRVPELLHHVAMARVVERQVRRELRGQAADLAPAHGVGLAGDGERPHARLADAPGEQMTVDDAVDLVDAGGGLVYTLRERRDCPRCAGEQREERLPAATASSPQACGGGRDVGTGHARGRQRLRRSSGVIGNEGSHPRSAAHAARPAGR